MWWHSEYWMRKSVLLCMSKNELAYSAKGNNTCQANLIPTCTVRTGKNHNFLMVPKHSQEIKMYVFNSSWFFRCQCSQYFSSSCTEAELYWSVASLLYWLSNSCLSRSLPVFFPFGLEFYLSPFSLNLSTSSNHSVLLKMKNERLFL